MVRATLLVKSATVQIESNYTSYSFETLSGRNFTATETKTIFHFFRMVYGWRLTKTKTLKLLLKIISKKFGKSEKDLTFVSDN